MKKKIIQKNGMLNIPIKYLTEEDCLYYIERNIIRDDSDISYIYPIYSAFFNNELDEILSFPREMKILPHHNFEIEDTNIYHPFNFEKTKNIMTSKFSLREYQVEPVQKVLEHLKQKKSGILECPAGGGKTNMGIWITQHMNLKTLFICDQYELLEQAYERFENFGCIKPNVLTSSRVEDNNAGITLTLFQSLAANKEMLNKIKNEYGLIIIDECHISSAPSYNRILSQLQGLRLGLTATDRRKDGLHYIYRRHLGDSICKVEVEMLKCDVEWHITDIEKGLIKKPYIPFNSKFSQGLMAKYYNELLNKILMDEDRNNFIVEKLEQCLKENRTILVITKTIEHINILQKKLSDRGILSCSLNSKLKKEENLNNLQLIKNKKIKILLTVNKANKGMDIDILDTLFLCIGGNNDVNWEQRIGRIQRFQADKQKPLIIDISDKKIKEFSDMAKNRSAFYFKQGFEQKILNRKQK